MPPEQPHISVNIKDCRNSAYFVHDLMIEDLFATIDPV